MTKKRVTMAKYLLTGGVLLALGLWLYPHNKPIEVIAKESIISEQMVLGKLQTESQIVSLTQDIKKKDTYIDDSFLGERHTELTIKGTVKLGLNTSDIKVKSINNGIVTLHIRKPQIISLELPYDDITFEKTQGWLRSEMSEKERREFYNAVEKNVRKSLLADKDLMKQADVFNRNTVEELLKAVNVKVIFE